MKSYFAKLAARAAHANVPVTSKLTAKKSPEPIDESPASAFQSISPQATDRIRSADEAPRSTSRLTPLRAESINVVPPKSEEAPTEFTGHRSTVPRPEPQPSDFPSEPDAELRLAPPSTDIEGRHGRTPDERLDQTPTSGDPIYSLTSLSPDSEIRSPERMGKSDLTDASLTNDRLAQIQREQSVLLRKADEFMERVFVRSKEASDREIESDDEIEEPSPPQTRVVEPSQLRPLTRDVPPPEQIDERPGLVIGNLTVEVMPAPSPAPVTPLQRVVVVRGSRQRAVLPSSRRFGLGQF
jgi:hypothetical protein